MVPKVAFCGVLGARDPRGSSTRIGFLVPIPPILVPSTGLLGADFWASEVFGSGAIRNELWGGPKNLLFGSKLLFAT